MTRRSLSDPRRRCSWIALVVAVAMAGGCGGHEPAPYLVVSGPRDWAAHPAIVQLDGVRTLYALSDVHGGYDRAVALLARHGLVSLAAGAAPRWSGGDSTLVVVGDLIDKGPSPVEVVDLFRDLEADAAAAGGHVVVTLGNHEAEFLRDPENDKASASAGYDTELRADGLDPVASADGSDARGRWLRERPFAARVGHWFFAHAGNARGLSLPELETTLRRAVDAHDYADDAIVGSDSILEARGWWSADAGIGARYAAALGVRHIVFGHDPDALGARGAIATAQDGALFRVDCGMSPDVDDSHGALLRVRVEGDTEIAEELAADGTVRELWRGPAG